MLDHFRQLLVALRRDEAAVTAMEYALIAALIAVVIVGALMSLGGQMGGTFSTVSNAL